MAWTSVHLPVEERIVSWRGTARDRSIGCLDRPRPRDLRLGHVVLGTFGRGGGWTTPSPGRGRALPPRPEHGASRDQGCPDRGSRTPRSPGAVLPPPDGASPASPRRPP